MRNLIIALAIFLLNTSTYANEWQDVWTDAVRHCEEDSLLEAEFCFNQAIDLMEASNDASHPYVYVDRARLFLLTDRPEKALPDLNKAIESNKLVQQDLIRALVTRIMVCARLGLESDTLDDMRRLREVNTNSPQVEFTEKNIIIRNVPECDCYRSIITQSTLDMGLCDRVEDVLFLKSDICIIKRNGNNNCKDCGLDPEGVKPLIVGDTAQDCQKNCDKLAVVAATACSRWFKKLRCQAACCLAVDYIRDICHWCCSEGNFKKKCAEPFSRITDYIKEPCDPAWD